MIASEPLGIEGAGDKCGRRLVTVAHELNAVGGSEIAQLRVVAGLSRIGWSVNLLFVNGGDLWPQWSAIASKTKAVRAWRPEPSAILLSGSGTVAAMFKVVRSDAQVVYLHSPGDLPAAFVATRAKRIPVALHLHLPPPYRQPQWLNRLIRKADALITPSVDAAERWAHVAHLSLDRVAVIPTGIDVDLFVPMTETERHEQRLALGIDPERPMILYAGRLDPTKGLTHLFEALRRLEQRVSLVVCGGGPDPGYVESLHRDSSGLDVTWIDRRLDVRSLLAAADLVVLPSLVAETQGMVLTEAMSCATPAVAAAVGGIPETMVGFPDHLVPPGDAPALAQAIDRLVGWRQHAPSLGDDSRRWVVENLPLNRTVDEVSTLLTRLVGR